MTRSTYINLPDNTPDGRRFWLDESQFNIDSVGMPVPFFSFGEAGKAFFGRSKSWLHDMTHVHPDYFYLDGAPFEFRYSASGIRYLSLAEVERLAHALYQSHPRFALISLATTVNTVKYSALSHGYLTIDGNQVNGEDVPRAWKKTNQKKR